MCGHLVPASHVICGGGYMCGHLVPASHPTSRGACVSCDLTWHLSLMCHVTWPLILHLVARNHIDVTYYGIGCHLTYHSLYHSLRLPGGFECGDRSVVY